MKLQSSGGDNTLDEFFQAISDPATQGSPLLSTGHMNKVLSVPIRSEFLSSGGRRAVGERESVRLCHDHQVLSGGERGESLQPSSYFQLQWAEKTSEGVGPARGRQDRPRAPLNLAHGVRTHSDVYEGKV